MTCGNRLWLRVLPFLPLFALGTPARSDVVYQNTFESTAGPGWSSPVRDITPKGARRFLGKFGNSAVTLSLGDLPVHTGLRVSFDLYVIQYWAGNGTYYGPHLWEFGLANAPALLHTTFSNEAQPQAFPGDYPEVNNPAYTGAVEKNTLGYPESGDSVYRLTFDIYHTDPSVVFRFAGSRLNGLPATHWGLDNVRVETIPMAKPGASRRSLVTNGDFETPIVTSRELMTVNAPSEAIVGWNVSDGSVDLNGEYWQNASGRQSLDMSGLDRAGTVTQDIATTPGKSYVLSFHLAGNPGGQPVKYLEVWWGGTRIDTAAFDVTGKTFQNMGWQPKEYLVTTPPDAGAATHLKFVSLNQDSFGPALDLVRVVPAVPGDLVVNGEFEYPTVAEDRTTYGLWETFESWTVMGGSAQQVTDWQPAAGRTSLHLNGSGPGLVEQTVLGLGTGEYLLRFSMAGDPEGSPGARAMDVSWDGRLVASPTFDTTGHSKAAMGWTSHAVLVAAPAGSVASLSFQSRTPGVHGPAVDSVSLAPAVAGDVDDDGHVTVADAIAAMRMVTGLTPPESGAAARADIAPWVGLNGRLHGNGVRDVADVRAILLLASGLEDSDESKIRRRYAQWERAIEIERVDLYMLLFSPSYLGDGFDYAEVRIFVSEMFDQYAIEHAREELYDIRIIGNTANVLGTEIIDAIDTFDNNRPVRITADFNDIWRFESGDWFMYGNQRSNAAAVRAPTLNSPPRFRAGAGATR